MKMASSVELGPGMRFDTPSRSRNRSELSQPRRRTTSLSMIAMCAAGPPKAVNPSRRKSRATSESVARGRGAGRGAHSTPSASIALQGRGDARVEREPPRALRDEKDAAEEHRVVGPRLVRHRPEAALEEDGDLRCREGDEHV